MTRDEAKSWIKETCGEGWLSLVDHIYDTLPDKVRVVAVFQKWGALKFTLQVADPAFEIRLQEVEARSLQMCEVCGQTGGEVIKDGWVQTLCEKHAQRSLGTNKRLL